MAKLAMKLVNIYALAEDSSALLRRLQEMSVLDIETAAGDEETSLLPEGYERKDTESKAAVYDRNAKTAEDALAVIQARFPEKKGLLSGFCAPRTVDRKDFYLSREQVAAALSVSTDAVENERRIAELQAEAVRLRMTAAQMRPWEPLDVPLSFSGTAKTAAFIGTVAGVYEDAAFLALLAEKAPDLQLYGEVVSTGSDMTYVFVSCPRDEKTAAENLLREMGFARPFQITSKLPRDKIRSKEERIADCETNIAQCVQNIKQAAEKRQEIEVFCDCCRVRADRYRAMAAVSCTKHTVLIRGYVAAVDLDALTKRLNDEFTVVIESADANDALAPVRLKNSAFSEPAEIITEMYALPSRTDVDPSPITGFFYYLFFGMMLSDAGYGLIMVVATLLALTKLKLKPSMRKNMKLFLYCGISTTLWGFVFGSFFGDSIAVISKTFFGTTVALPALIDPMKGDAVLLLLISVALGFLQIIVGLATKFYMDFKAGDKAAAFFDSGLWITTLFGIAMLAVGMFTVPVLKTAGAVVAIASAVGLILTQGRDKKNWFARLFSGVASLYDITGYVSDLLSFSRLMALGLTTAAMSAVFNLLGTLAGGGIAGLVLLIIIFPVGHAINFGLNALGAYVHTLRLQYVELFSKFYDGGGRAFKPFSFRSKYVGLNEENFKEEN